MTFGLAPAIVADFHRIFRHYSEIERVLIFGSRAKNTYKDSSDIDLASCHCPDYDRQYFRPIMERNR
ncbi:nucleotidyltransferase domain-containing protein [Nitrosomonas communis]